MSIPAPKAAGPAQWTVAQLNATSEQREKKIFVALLGRV